ncbi:MAG: hypothetical protein HKP30_01560 [Myxococcales bacterium]|nr:hypothetical protein [Myxococcales bacterium]
MLRGSLAAVVMLALVLGAAGAAWAGSLDQARRMHDRLVGIPPAPDSTTLQDMVALIDAGNPLAAADLAMTNPVFYTTTLKNFATPWTNETGDVFADLNDYTATVIGMIRDEVPFDQVLSADLVYVGAAGVVPSAYSHTDNVHYEQLAANRVDLSNPLLFEGVAQSGLPGSMLMPGDAAGVTTTRAAGEAFFQAGTNRRMLRFIAMNHLCRDMEQLKDITRPVDRIRQDVSRSPGGDSSIFHNHCTGCHAGLDPMAGAFAYFEWDPEQERVVFTRGQVQPKHLINASTAPYGYVTVDDRWDNYWREGPNAVLGWGATAGGGFGPQSLGEEVTASRAFSVCTVEKVFAQVCFRPPNSPADRAAIDRIADVFEQQNYSMKRVFAETAVECMGE